MSTSQPVAPTQARRATAQRATRALLVTAMLCSSIGLTSATAHASAATADKSSDQRVLTELGTVPDLLQPSAPSTAMDEASSGVSIRLDGSAGTATRVSSGLTVTPNALPHIDAAVKSDDTGVSHIVVLKDSTAATNVTFTVAKAGTKLVADPLGGITLIDANGRFDSRISAPWAYDAKGRSLPTNFTIDGATVTQHIDTRNAIFPVVADPHYTWGWVTGTVYFNRSETQKIAAYENWLTVVGWFMPPPFDTVLSVYQLVIHYTAQHAESAGLCVKVKSNGAVGVYGGTQGDGYCR